MRGARLGGSSRILRIAYWDAGRREWSRWSILCSARRCAVMHAGILAWVSRQFEAAMLEPCWRTWALRADEASASRSIRTPRSWPTIGSVMGEAAMDRRTRPASKRGPGVSLLLHRPFVVAPRSRRWASELHSGRMYLSAHAMSGLGVRCAVSVVAASARRRAVGCCRGRDERLRACGSSRCWYFELQLAHLHKCRNGPQKICLVFQDKHRSQCGYAVSVPVDWLGESGPHLAPW